MEETSGETCTKEDTSTKEDNHNMDVDIEALLSRDRPLGRRRRTLCEAPEFTQRLNAYEEVDAGSSVIFTCKYKALPKPTVKWYRDDEEVTDHDGYDIEEGDNGELRLTIKKTTKKDEGAFKCKAENAEGVASTTGYLSVKGDVKDKPLSAQPRKNVNPDHVVSSPPHLRTIIEQKSVEEREAEEQMLLPPSPIHDYIEEQQSLLRRGMINWQQLTGCEDLKAEVEDSGSDTSVESQDFDRIPYQEMRERTPEGDLHIDDVPPGGVLFYEPPDGALMQQSSGGALIQQPAELSLVDQTNTNPEVPHTDAAYDSLGSIDQHDEVCTSTPIDGSTEAKDNSTDQRPFNQNQWAERFAQQIIDNSLQIVENNIYNSIYDEGLQLSESGRSLANISPEYNSLDSGFYDGSNSTIRLIDHRPSSAEEKELEETLSKYREIVQEVTETVQNVNSANIGQDLAQPHQLIVEELSSYIQVHQVEPPTYRLTQKVPSSERLTPVSDMEVLPWMYYLAFIAAATLLAAATGVPPSAFCISIAALSLISFQFLDESSIEGKR